MVKKLQYANLTLLVLALIVFTLSTDSLSDLTNIAGETRYFMQLASVALLVTVLIITLVIEFKFKNKK